MQVRVGLTGGLILSITVRSSSFQVPTGSAWAASVRGGECTGAGDIEQAKTSSATPCWSQVPRLGHAHSPHAFLQTPFLTECFSCHLTSRALCCHLLCPVVRAARMSWVTFSPRTGECEVSWDVNLQQRWHQWSCLHWALVLHLGGEPELTSIRSDTQLLPGKNG